MLIDLFVAKNKKKKNCQFKLNTYAFHQISPIYSCFTYFMTWLHYIWFYYFILLFDYHFCNENLHTQRVYIQSKYAEPSDLLFWKVNFHKHKFTNSLLVTVVASFTTGTTKKAIYILSLMFYSINTVSHVIHK